MAIITANNSSELLCSVQSYNRSGVEVSSQLVFDVDNTDMVEAYDIAMSISDDVQCEYDTDTSVWFSGSKGFHIVTGLVGYGEYANIAMRSIAFEISKEIDPAMYKSRSLFRLPNSINSKSGLHKIQVRDRESLDSILDRAKTSQPVNPIEYDYNNKIFADRHKASIESIKYSMKHSNDAVISHKDWKETLSPCIVSMLDKGIPEGFRYETGFYLIRHFRLCGIDVDEAISIASTMDIFEHYTDSMIHHYYNGIVRSVGCLHGPLSDMMQANCKATCVHSKEFSDGVARNFIKII